METVAARRRRWPCAPCLLLLALTCPAAASTLDPRCPPPQPRIDAILAGETGALPLRARFSIEEGPAGELAATVELTVDLRRVRGHLPALPQPLCVTLLLEGDEGVRPAGSATPRVAGLAGAERWIYTARLALPEDAVQVGGVVEEPTTGLWGAALADEAVAEIPPAGAGAVAVGRDAWYRLVAPPGPAVERITVVRLVPPHRPVLTGSTRFDALVTTPEVDRVVFYLDGAELASDAHPPFVAHLPLADPPREQQVRAVALDGGGAVLGEDTLAVNRPHAPFRVTITRVRHDPATGRASIAAEVTVPAGATLDHLELYRGETRLATFTEAPLDTRFDLPDPRPDDYLRVAAFLTDGRSIDDVVLLADPEAEEVEVNLVEIYSVVTDPAGRPIRDLRQDDFTVLLDGVERRLDSFAYADDVPLLLGLVVDTSGSMALIMDATKKAAARFLSDTVLPRDRAFLVDFADRPRLLQPTSGDLAQLFLGLGKLTAEGTTALYDAIIFSMLQFADQTGRKALVVLTDGDDRDSRFGPKDCVEVGVKAGVPIYLVGLGGLDRLARSFPKGALERITAGTGGRLYFVGGVEELARAYAEINGELRSQYFLAFYAGRDLDPATLRTVTVKVDRPGATARVVLGAGAAGR